MVMSKSFVAITPLGNMVIAEQPYLHSKDWAVTYGEFTTLIFATLPDGFEILGEL